MTPTFRAAIYALAGVVSGGCIHTLPPPPAPAAEMPDLDAVERPEIVEGQGRVVIATDVPARVEVASVGVSAVALPANRLLCPSTPCVASLGHGPHDLAFKGLADDNRVSTARVEVTGPDLVVNHHLGLDRFKKPGINAPALIGVGAAALLFIAAAAVRHQESADPDVATGLDVAAIVVAVGVLAFEISSMSRTFREGATTTWTPSPGTPSHASMGFSPRRSF